MTPQDKPAAPYATGEFPPTVWVCMDDYNSADPESPDVGCSIGIPHKREVGEALLAVEEKIAREVVLDEEGDPELYRTGYEQAVDDCRMLIRAAAHRASARKGKA